MRSITTQLTESPTMVRDLSTFSMSDSLQEALNDSRGNRWRAFLNLSKKDRETLELLHSSNAGIVRALIGDVDAKDMMGVSADDLVGMLLLAERSNVPIESFPEFADAVWATRVGARFSDIRKLMAEPKYSAALNLDSPQRWETERPLRQTLNTFGAKFMGHPYELSRKMLGVAENAQVFQMCLSLDEQNICSDRGFSVRPGTHVPGAFAYLRYYDLGQLYLVVEIQSDQFRHVKQNQFLANRYAHWSKLLLLAFEDYVSMIASRKEVLSIGIVTPEFVQARWAPYKDLDETIYETEVDNWNLAPGIAPTLADRLYNDLPYGMGYKRYTVQDEEFGMAIENGVDGPPIQVEELWFKPLSSFGQTPFIDSFRSTRAVTQSVNMEAVEKCRDLLEIVESSAKPASEWINARDSTHTRVLQQFANPRLSEYQELEKAIVCVEQFSSLNQPVGVIPLDEYYLESLDSFAWRIPSQLRSNEHTFISRGTDQGVGTDWLTKANAAMATCKPQVVHGINRDRHPVIFLIDPLPEERIVTIGIKGGGARVVPEMRGVAVPLDGTRLPVYLNRGTQEFYVQDSHRFWGGLSSRDAQLEMNHLLYVNLLMKLIDPEIKPAVPFPIDWGILKTLPIWKDGEESLVTSDKYRESYLSSPYTDDNRLGTLRTLSECDVRISQLVNEIMNPAEEIGSNIYNLKEHINRAMAFLYLVHGEHLRVPDASIDVDITRGLTVVNVAEYLKRIYECNAIAAEKILLKVETRSLKTLASIHGANWHAGGAQMPSLGLAGAVMGGATAPRNMDITGVMHDWDSCALVGILTNLVDQDVYSDLGQHQAADLFRWQESMYWMRFLLRGREMRPGQRLPTRPFGLPGAGVYTVESGIDLVDEENFRLVEPAWSCIYKRGTGGGYEELSLPDSITVKAREPLFEGGLRRFQFVESSHSQIYRDYSQHGRAAYRQYLHDKML